MNNNENNELVRYAMEKIRRDSKCKPQCISSIVGPTGPTGPSGGPTGATARFNNSYNKIIHNFKLVSFNYKLKKSFLD